MFEFNPVAVFLASLVGVYINILWYSDLGLGRLWQKLVGKEVQPPKRSTKLLAALNLIRHLASAWLIAITSFLYHRHYANGWAEDVFTSALILGVGLVIFPVIYIKLCDGKSIRESSIYALQELASMAGMAAVISLIR